MAGPPATSRKRSEVINCPYLLHAQDFRDQECVGVVYPLVQAKYRLSKSHCLQYLQLSKFLAVSALR